MKLVSTVAFISVVFGGGLAHADKKKLSDLQRPDKKVALREWKPFEQYFPVNSYNSSDRSNYGYADTYGALVLADELGDKFGHAGKLSLVHSCFQFKKPEAASALLWAACGQDVNEVDITKVEAELKAGGFDDEDIKTAIEEGKKVLADAKKIGEAVEGAAKTDKGVAAVLALGTSARSEWTAFASKNKDALANLDKLQDIVRSNKNGQDDGCLKTAAPPFQKLVHAAKFPWEEDGDIMDFYYRHLPATTEAYITILTYAACALATSDKGKGPYTVAANRKLGAAGMARRGPRSLTVAKAYDEAFKPKFADRDLTVDTVRGMLKGSLELTGTDLVSSIGTSTTGKVSSTKKKDDMTVVGFGADKVEACLQWKETSKVQSVNNGNVMYEKQCVKRGMVDNQTGETEVPTVFAAGIAKGVDLIAVFGFPVVAYKSKEKVLTAVWGVAR